jgi:hypothetical protein
MALCPPYSIPNSASSLQWRTNGWHQGLGLALQLRFLFDVSTPCHGLVSASPKRPRDNVRRLDTPLCELDGDAADFLDRPAD